MTYKLTTVDSTDKEAQIFALAGELCVFHAAEVTPKILEIVKPHIQVEVDLAGVDEIDIAGVQLLLMVKRHAIQQECDLLYINHSRPMLEMIELLNLSQSFGDPVLLQARHQETENES